MREDAMVKAVGHERLTGILISTSVFRRLVSEATSQSELDAIRASILMDQTITSFCSPRIISSLFADWKTKLPAGTA